MRDKKVFNVVPLELKSLRQWVVWKADKVPYSPGTIFPAKAGKPDTWRAYGEAIKAWQSDPTVEGIGFQFSETDPYCGIDLDNCLDDQGNPKDWAKPIIEQLGPYAYSEQSPSGTGMHFFIQAKLEGSGKKIAVGDGAIEVYDKKRYFTVTGIEGCGAPKAAQDVLESLRDEHFPQTPPKTNAKGGRSDFNGDSDTKHLSEALNAISPDCDYDTWCKIGMALYHSGQSFDVWDSWSSGGSTYKVAEMRSKWESFGNSPPAEKCDLGTVFHYAKEAGWNPPKREKREKTKVDGGRIYVDTNQPAADWLPEVWSHWKNVEDGNHVFFERHRQLCFLRKGQTEAVTKETLEPWLSNHVTFYQVRKSEKGDFYTKNLNPMPRTELAMLVANIPPHVPELDVIYNHPVYDTQCNLIDRDGYVQDLKAYLHLKDVPRIDTTPVPGLGHLNDMLADFDFDGDHSYANYIGYLLTFPLRPYIRDNVPMFTISAPVQGSGKTMLLNLAALIWTGKPLRAIAYGNNSLASKEERKKKFTSIMMTSPEAVTFDNVTAVIDDDNLSMALTQGYFEDRILGASKMERIAVKALISANGNNLAYAQDIQRRISGCKLGAEGERPELRDDFVIPDLEEWALEHRSELMSALIGMIEFWKQAGMPLKTDVTLGSYGRWLKTIGGVLDSFQIEGFMSNIQDAVSDELLTLRSFFNTVYEQKGSTEWTPTDVFHIASYDEENGGGENMLGDMLGDKGKRSREIRLGKLLFEKCKGRQYDCEVGTLKLELTPTRHGNKKHYRLRLAE